MRLPIFCLVTAAAAVFFTPAASAQDFAAGIGVGTAGLEAQAAFSVNDRLSLRASGNYLDVDRSENFDDVDYDAVLEASTVAGFVDLRPFANAFTLTGGAYLGSREASLTGTPTTPVEIGGTTFTPTEVGSLVGGIDLGEFAPFVGLGFDNTFTRSSPWGLRLNAGVAVGQEPDVTLQSVGGTLTGDPTLNAELAAEAENISDDADVLRYYPVVSAGVTWRF
ncbi:MAG: hypothetical protein PVI23_01295 [Maricaulaceae bacterium]|jgi:hypothetical protein